MQISTTCQLFVKYDGITVIFNSTQLKKQNINKSSIQQTLHFDIPDTDNSSREKDKRKN